MCLLLFTCFSRPCRGVCFQKQLWKIHVFRQCSSAKRGLQGSSSNLVWKLSVQGSAHPAGLQREGKGLSVPSELARVENLSRPPIREVRTGVRVKKTKRRCLNGKSWVFNIPTTSLTSGHGTSSNGIRTVFEQRRWNSGLAEVTT